MANHTKPTQEELDQKIEESIENLEEEEEKDQEIEEKAEELEEEENVEEETDDEEVDEDEEETDEDDQEEDEDSEEEDKKDKEEPKEKVDSKKEDKEDYKKRYGDSTREAQILYDKNKKMSEAIAKASEVADPTDDELKAEYSDWDEMTDSEKKLAKKSMIQDRKLEAIESATKEFKELDAWNKKVDEFVIDPQTSIDFPDIEGKEEEFKNFVSKPSNMGASFDLLVDSFLYQRSKNKKSKKGRMMPTGNGGNKKSIKKKTGKLSADDSRRLRLTNYKKYAELLKKGKISIN